MIIEAVQKLIDDGGTFRWYFGLLVLTPAGWNGDVGLRCNRLNDVLLAQGAVESGERLIFSGNEDLAAFTLTPESTMNLTNAYKRVTLLVPAP